METIVITAERRDVTGRRANEYLRKNGRIPAIVYGHKENPDPISLPRHEIEIALERGAHLLEMDIAGKKAHVLVKEVQFDYLGVDVMHVDLARVDLTETIRLRVPVEYKGEPIGAHEGGLLDHHLMELEIECRTADIPPSIPVKVEHMHVGDSLYVRDVIAAPGIKLITNAEDVVCTVRASTAAAAAAAEEGAPGEEESAEPEVIGKSKEESGEGQS